MLMLTAPSQKSTTNYARRGIFEKLYKYECPVCRGTGVVRNFQCDICNGEGFHLSFTHPIQIKLPTGLDYVGVAGWRIPKVDENTNSL